MHKPLRIIKDDARVRLTQQVNLTSAVRAALLTLPESFSETELFERIARISYTGDPRMVLPAENRGKVGNIVRSQGPQFKELYHRLVVGLPGVHWPSHVQHIHQDVSPQARSLHLRKLPVNLIFHLKQRYGVQSKEEENAYWVRLAGEEKLPDMLDRGKSDDTVCVRKLKFVSYRNERDCTMASDDTDFERVPFRRYDKERTLQYSQDWQMVERLLSEE